MSAPASASVESNSIDQPPATNRVRRTALVLMLFGFGGLQALPETRTRVYEAFCKYASIMVDWQALLIIPGAVLTLWLIIRLDNKLRSLDMQWLEWSPFSLKMNMAAVPVSMRRMGIPYVLLLLYSLPFMAWAEEKLFRYGADHWLMPEMQPGLLHWAVRGGVVLVWSGFAFGAIHFASPVPLRMVLCWSLAGVELYAIYSVSDIWVVTAFHTTFNVIVVGWVVFELRHRSALQKLLSDDSSRARIDRHFPTVATWVDGWV